MIWEKTVRSTRPLSRAGCRGGVFLRGWGGGSRSGLRAVRIWGQVGQRQGRGGGPAPGRASFPREFKVLGPGGGVAGGGGWV
ncbi:MAG: hypothetical protein ABF502_13165, partial [Acetobacter sp.]|uniref:hypothetical protein n=1 Tax=Acetobacter sp. TaxID=440 RepID=UPI0039E8A6B3